MTPTHAAAISVRHVLVLVARKVREGAAASVWYPASLTRVRPHRTLESFSTRKTIDAAAELLTALRAMKTFAFRCRDALADEARGAVTVVQRNDPLFTRDALGELGLVLALQHLKKKLNRKTFPRVKRLKSGRAADA